jgi:hypothetical protein
MTQFNISQRQDMPDSQKSFLLLFDWRDFIRGSLFLWMYDDAKEQAQALLRQAIAGTIEDSFISECIQDDLKTYALKKYTTERRVCQFSIRVVDFHVSQNWLLLAID